jgi:hypothetical protein
VFVELPVEPPFPPPPPPPFPPFPPSIGVYYPQLAFCPFTHVHILPFEIYPFMKPQPDHPEISVFDQSHFAPIFTGESFIHDIYLAIACSATLALDPNLA